MRGGGAFACYCYRDTKMEMQGLPAGARNTQQQQQRRRLHQRQHGVSCRPGSLGTHARSGSGVRGEPLSQEPEGHDDTSGRPGTSPFELEQNGSDHSDIPVLRQKHGGDAQPARSRSSALGDVMSVQGPGVRQAAPHQLQLQHRLGAAVENGEGAPQMAFPVDIQQALLQHTDAAGSGPGSGSSSRPGSGPSHTASCLKSSGAALDGKQGEEFYVVLNVASSDREMGRSVLPSDGKMMSKDVHASESKPSAPVPLQTEDRVLHFTPGTPRHVPGPTPRCLLPKQRAEQGGDLTMLSRYDGAERGTHPRASADSSPSAREVEVMEQTTSALTGRSAHRLKEGAACADRAQLSDHTCLYLSEVGAPTCSSTSASASGETFSGTIMVNNQSIVVTIENGILTLAAPPEGASQKEDVGGLLHFKEQLGIKEHQDIVLINYDSSTKSVGKNGSVSAGSLHSAESRSCLSLNDSGLSLEEDCSFSDPGSVLDGCSSAKDDNAFCSLAEGDVVDPESKVGAEDKCDRDDLASAKLSGMVGMMSKKGTMVAYCCPQSECYKTFDTKHKLKIHLLSHTEDQRPFKCPVEGCGWSFTTSYKLKRHLQSHDKVRPFTCEWENCGRKFTTVYNLKAHIKAHDQENAFVCEICSERFRSAPRLANHQRAHFEPERPHKCEFPGCEKTFITFSALFSHNRTHFRETGQFTCSYPGCDKRYDKACRLKIHLRSHTGERPFVCDSEGCGWSFTSMSKLLRHRRKHDDDRRFTCQQEGCGKSFTRAEHLKGHSITHLGTKPFECHVEGCSAKFSARSSLYIHSKKHQLDSWPTRARCPVSTCSKHFSSRGSLRSHVLKLHSLSPDLLSQLEMSTSLTPSSELTSAGSTAGDMDLGSLFSNVSGRGGGLSAVPAPSSAPSLTVDMSLVSSGILTIDAASVGATLASAGGGLAQTVDPLILTAGGGVGAAGFEGSTASVLPQGTLTLEDVQTVNPEALGSLAALALRAPSGTEHLGTEHLHTLTASSTLASDAPASLTPSSSLAAASGPTLLSAPPEPEQASGDAGLLGQQGSSKVITQFVFPGHAGSFTLQKESELQPPTACSFLDSGGSARTDYRAIQMAKKKKQRCPVGSPAQRKGKGTKSGSAPGSAISAGGRFNENVTSAGGGLTLRDPVTGTQYVQIQLLQDDPAGDGELAFQLSSQTSSSHSQLTVDLPVNILQETPTTGDDDAGSDTSQFTGSTINLQDLE